MTSSAFPPPSDRLAPLRDRAAWDVLIVGGGATGLGMAVDAATRGYRTLLLEARDFASGTSSRSTKLIHGGVRYLRRGDFLLVGQALRERARLLRNAPHLVHPLPFVIPAWGATERLIYAAGLKLYDALAGWRNLASSALLDRAETLAALPGLRSDGLCGGARYWDAQFDDARLALTLMRTAVDHGATCLNYLPVTQLIKENGKVIGCWSKDAESGENFEIRAKVVINATGVWADSVRALDDPNVPALLAPSQGVHLVFEREFMPGEHALLVPRTEDGRVLFAIPWQGRVLLGTTDTVRKDLPPEPQPLAGEVDYLLRAAAGVLRSAPQRGDIRALFVGLRPLLCARAPSAHENSAALSREHAVLIGESGLMTVTGGKWTTYRLMAEQAIDIAARHAGLPRAACRTRRLALHGSPPQASLDPYGTDRPLLAMLPGNAQRLHPTLPYNEAMVRFAVRYEAARNIDDILSRRTRLRFLDAAAASAAIERVGEILAEERGLTPAELDRQKQQARALAAAFDRMG